MDISPAAAPAFSVSPVSYTHLIVNSNIPVFIREFSEFTAIPIQRPAGAIADPLCIKLLYRVKAARIYPPCLPANNQYVTVQARRYKQPPPLLRRREAGSPVGPLPGKL